MQKYVPFDTELSLDVYLTAQASNTSHHDTRNAEHGRKDYDRNEFLKDE